MAYVLGQYNKNTNTPNDGFMSLIKNGTADRRPVVSDIGETTGSPFDDECCKGLVLEPSKKYYLHCKIKKDISGPMVFSVKLVKFEPDTENLEQYIKTITVYPGDNDDPWQDFELVFVPLSTFDTILFELKRIAEDYRVETRYPVIAYIELSEINDAINGVIGLGNKELIKIGVQSRPGLMMCINGEEIRTARSGIYELKNGDIVVKFFSVVNGATEDNNDVKTFMETVNQEYAEGIIPHKDIHSNCFFNSEKTRVIDSFTLDYVYKETEEE